MPPPSAVKISPELDAQVYERHQAGQTDGQIASWLQESHQVAASRLDVLRSRNRYAKRVIHQGGPPPPPPPLPLAPDPERLPRPRPRQEEAPGDLQMPDGSVLEMAEPAALVVPVADEDALRMVGRDLAHRYAREKDPELRLATASVFARVMGVLRMVKKDRTDLERAGRDEKQGPPVKGYLTVSPEDWPEPPGQPEAAPPAEPPAAGAVH